MHISVIDDEQNLADKITKKLQNSGYAASAFYSYAEFMQKGDTSSGLYIIDINLGNSTGFDIIRWLRKEKEIHVPIIIISGYGDTEKIVYGLDIGADDYLTKPFMPEELIARVRAILRRPTSINNKSVIRYKNISFNTVTKETIVGRKIIILTKNEGLVMETFLSNQNKILPRELLVSNVWGGHRTETISDNTINVTLFNLKKKLGTSFEPKTIYKQGYILD